MIAIVIVADAVVPPSSGSSHNARANGDFVVTLVEIVVVTVCIILQNADDRFN